MYSEKLAQTKASLDPKILLAVSNVKTEDSLRAIIEKYHIRIDMAQEFFAAIMLLSYGAIESDECLASIKASHAVPEAFFPNLVQDVNTEILNPIQEKLKADSIINKPGAAQSNILDPLEDEVDENLQQAIARKHEIDEHFETAEETLARIDREVAAEIDAEIDAEIMKLAQAESEAEAARYAEQKSMAKTQNKITADLNLDEIPKSEAATYIHRPLYREEAAVEDLSVSTAPINNSLDFIQSKASGNMPSTTNSASTKSYVKDPYKEEL